VIDIDVAVQREGVTSLWIDIFIVTPSLVIDIY
jgi:hypothetical protein